MNLRKTENNGNFNVDVLVIGGGTAGLPAALSAVEGGAKKVFIVEKRMSLGGNGLRATGMFGAESPLQKRAGLSAPREELFKRAMKWHHWDRVDPKIIRSLINRSGETIGWLEEKGVEFREGTPSSFHPGQLPTWHVPKGCMAGVVKILAEKCREKGVRVALQASCKKIIKEKESEIFRVLAEKGNEEIEITAGSVIIATGGFAGNKDLLKTYFPWFNDIIQNRGVPNTGDGLTLARDVGADIQEFATMIKEGPMVPGLNLFSGTSRFVREPSVLWVNKKGSRFMDESVGTNLFVSVNSMLRQPDMISYALADDGIVESVEKKWKDLKHPLLVEKKWPGLSEELRGQSVKHDRVRISESWNEIAAWMDTDPETLKGTVEEYNTLCDAGRDSIFAKDPEYLIPLRRPPFYAIRTVPNMLDTIGGIKVNEHMQVLDKAGIPLPGLYAAGVVTGGWQSYNYCIELSGTAVGFSLTSGRIAGGNAAPKMGE